MAIINKLAISGRYLPAGIVGDNVWGYRILFFAVSSFITGGAVPPLWAHHVLVISDEHFTIGHLAQYLTSISSAGTAARPTRSS